MSIELPFGGEVEPGFVPRPECDHDWNGELGKTKMWCVKCGATLDFDDIPNDIIKCKHSWCEVINQQGIVTWKCNMCKSHTRIRPADYEDLPF